MITTKQRRKSYRVAQHDTGMREACRINVRCLMSDRSFVSVNYPNGSKLQRKSVEKEVCSAGDTGDRALFVVPKKQDTLWGLPWGADQMIWDTAIEEQRERSVGE